MSRREEHGNISVASLKKSIQALKASLRALNDTHTISKNDPTLKSLKNEIRDAIRKAEGKLEGK